MAAAPLQPDQATLTAISGWLTNTTNPDKATRQQGFAVVLLQLVGTDGVDKGVRQAGAIHFKNFVKQRWTQTADDAADALVIPEEDKARVRRAIVDVTITAPALVQTQLAEAVRMMADADFPDKWGDLLTTIATRMTAATSMSVVHGLLEIANSVFKRYRGAQQNDEVFRPLKICIDSFQAPLLSITTKLAAALDGQQGADALRPIVLALRTACRCFYSLNWVTIPEAFEDNIKGWMALHHKLLTYRSAALVDEDEEEEIGPLERLHEAVCANVALYADKYDEEFEPFFKEFVSAVWRVISRPAGPSGPQAVPPKMDGLFAMAMKFLSTAATKTLHRGLFEKALTAITQQVVLPNLHLRQSDVELFEDAPDEYVRRDMEGSDIDTRRRAAADLLQALTKAFEAQIMPEVTSRVKAAQDAYGPSNPDGEGGWRGLEGAVTLMEAFGSRASTRQMGVTVVAQNMGLEGFISTVLEPQLRQGATPEGCNSQAQLKASCLRFLCHFRGVMAPATLNRLLPMVARFLMSRDRVLQTYAAQTIEKMLLVKPAKYLDSQRMAAVAAVGGPRAEGARAAAAAAGGAAGAATPAGAKNARAVTTETLQRLAKPLVSALLQRVNPAAGTDASAWQDNPAMMSCLHRVIQVSPAACVVPETQAILAGVSTAIGRTALNPAQPQFTHMLFECVTMLMRKVCASNPAVAAAFEQKLFPVFTPVLARNIEEFLPYVFQVMAQLLDLRRQAGNASLSDDYKKLLKPLVTTASLWLAKANVPALTVLLRAYLRCNAREVVGIVALPSVLGVCQKLLVYKQTEVEGFQLFEAVVENLPTEILAPVANEIWKVMISRLMKHRTTRFVRAFIRFTAVFAGVHGGAPVISGMDSVGANMANSVLANMVAAQANKVIGRVHRKVVAFGLARIACDKAAAEALLGAGLAGQNPTWQAVLTAATQLCLSGVADRSTTEEDEVELQQAALELQGEGYAVQYARLASAATSGVHDPFPSVGLPPRKELAQAVGALDAAVPGKVLGLLASLGGAEAAALAGWCKAAGVKIAGMP